MQDGMAAGVEHGRAGRGLDDIAAYDPSAEANFVYAVNALRAVNFPLLAQLESQKDASMADIMDLLCLESHVRAQRIKGDTTARRSSLTDAMVPLLEPLSAKSLTGETSTSGFPVMTTALSTTFVQASTVPPAPSAEVPPSPKIAFKQEELDTTPEHASTP
ncbi:hypothetical protein Tco_0240513, partial [Tanacetum coccineum]